MARGATPVRGRRRAWWVGLTLALLFALACLESPRIRRGVVTLIEIAVLYVTWPRG